MTLPRIREAATNINSGLSIITMYGNSHFDAIDDLKYRVKQGSISKEETHLTANEIMNGAVEIDREVSRCIEWLTRIHRVTEELIDESVDILNTLK